MTTEQTVRRSWWSRNQWPLFVGALALVALLGWTLVGIDRFSDDDDQHHDDGDRVGDRSRDDDRITPFLSGVFEASGLLLGAVFDDFDRLVVTAVIPGTPADEARLRRGDQILEVDGERVRDVDELSDAIENVPLDQTYDLTIERDDDELTLDVWRAGSFFAEGPNERGFGPGRIPRFGERQRDRPQLDPRLTPAPDEFELQRLRPMLGVTVVQTPEGLQVMTVSRGSAAEQAGIRDGDVITKVGRTRTRTIDQLRDALPLFDLRGSERPNVVGRALEVTVLRAGHELELEVVFSLRPEELFPTEPPVTALSPLAEEALLEMLESMERQLFSDEFMEVLVARVLEEIEPLVLTPPQAPGDAQPPPAQLDLADLLAGLDVFAGSVSAVSDSSITLTGSRGAISFTLTDATVFVGASPRVGGVASVAVDQDGVAVLVVVAG